MKSGTFNSILIGILVGILSLATQSIGLTLQRKSHLLEDAKLSSQRHIPAYRRPLWQLGCFLFIVSNVVGSSIQITTLPLIVLSPLQAVGLVFNSICGFLILNESFTNFMLRGTVFVSIGAFFIGYFGSIPEPNHNLQELLELLKRKAFVIWFGFSVGLIVLILVYISALEWYLNQATQTSSDLNSEVTEVDNQISDYYNETDTLLAGPPVFKHDSILTEDSARSLGPKATSTLLLLKITSRLTFVECHNIRFVHGMLYGVICGNLSAHALLLAKSAVELVIVAVTEKTLQDIKNYQSWLILIGWVFCAVMQVYYLNLGLKIISSSIMFPLIFCVYNMINILNGLIYFNQFNKLTFREITMIFLGIALILIGVFYLSINDINSHNLANAPVPEPQEDVFPGQPTANIKNLAITTLGTQFNHAVLKNTSHTPSLAVSKAHSIMTNSSLKPILSSSYDGSKFQDEENTLV